MVGAGLVQGLGFTQLGPGQRGQVEELRLREESATRGQGLGGWAVSYERGTPVCDRPIKGRGQSMRPCRDRVGVIRDDAHDSGQNVDGEEVALLGRLEQRVVHQVDAQRHLWLRF